jgi:hypothetical protein
LTGLGVLTKVSPALAATAGPQSAPVAEKAKVYFTKELSAEGLRKMFSLVNRRLTGKVAVKLHTRDSPMNFAK